MRQRYMRISGTVPVDRETLNADFWSVPGHRGDVIARSVTAAGPQSAQPPERPAFAVEPNPVFAPFTAGNIVVYRIGPIGGGALNREATAVFIDEYTAAGVFVQTIALPTTDSGIHQTLTASGTLGSDGLLTRSTDGHHLLLTGYDAAVGTPDVTAAAGVDRVVGRIAADGTVDTSTALSDFPTFATLHGVASTDGADFWVSSNGRGLSYTTIGSTTATHLTTVTGVRGVEIFDGQLYVSAFDSLSSVGIGLPTTTGQTLTELMPDNAFARFFQFFFADLTASVAGLDTVYVSDDVSGLLKYSLVAGTWTLNGTVGAGADDYFGLTGSVSGTTVTLYASRLNGSSADQIVSLIDTGGYNAAFSITTPTVLATASANTAFRGIAFAPTPGETQTVVFKPTSVVQYEGNSGTTVYTFTVTRTGGTIGQLDFSGTLALGTTDAADYVGGVAPTVFNGSILAGQASATVTVNIQGDLTIESGESFTLTLTNVSNGAAGVAEVIGVNKVATGNITDDEAPGSLSINDVSIIEGNSGTSLLTFTVTRSGIGGAVTADWTISAPGGAGNANAADFVAGSVFAGQVAFADGESTKTISIGVQGDVAFEADEAFTVTLSNATGGAGIGDGTGVGTIVNDDFTSAGTTVTIDFNPLLTASGKGYLHPGHYFEHGLHFSTNGSAFVRMDQGPFGPALADGYNGSYATSPILYIRPMTSDPFGIVSIDLDGLYDYSFSGVAVTFNFTAMTVDGQTRTASFTTDAAVGLQTFSFPPDFVGLTELRWTMNAGWPVGVFDNVVINATETHSFVGTDHWDVMAGTDADDVFLLGGEGAYLYGHGDVVHGRGGNDLFYFGESFLDDHVNGGEGEDRLLLQGNYHYPAFLGPRLTGVETVVLMSGSDTSYGDVAGNSYVYDLDFRGAVVAGQLLRVDGSALRAGETFTFDSEVQDGRFALTGGGGDDVLTAGWGSDSLDGGAGNDLLDGNRGADAMAGGAGDDVFKVDNMGDTILETVGQGKDRVFASASYTLTAGAEVEMLTTASNFGSAAINLTGNALVQGIYGNAGPNQLSGGGGADSLAGFEGNDWYFITDGREVVFESAGEGNDRIFTSVDYRLRAGASVEVITTNLHVGTAAIDITGNELANTIYGNDGDNRLDGDYGADTLVGRAGNDWFFVDNAGDVVQEDSGGGADRVFASVSYALTAGADVEMLTTDSNSGMAAINLTGNALGQGIYGNAGANQLTGGGGADSLVGFGGDDWYFIVDGRERVFESVSGGNDRVFASVSYTLTAGAEVELLATAFPAGTAAINLTGNELANTIHGNAGANRLEGAAGNDALIGNEGDDILDGGTGNDILDGGTGNDILRGGMGDDWHFVDSAGDMLIEAVGEGTLDRVFARVSYTLTAGAEVELMTTDHNSGTAAINLTGNELANIIHGNDGDNKLDGGAGADTLVGRAGNDQFFVDNAGDYIFEAAGEGNDRLFASASYTLAAGAEVELMTTGLHAGTAAINLTGNELANTIYGNDGNNILDGKGGSDSLVGLAGADTFAFTTALGAGNVDQVFGFTNAVDRIALGNAIFGAGIGAPGAFNANAFYAGTAAHDADDRIIYNSATGQLFFDADGSGAGAAVQFATLSPGLALTAGDFAVI